MRFSKVYFKTLSDNTLKESVNDMLDISILNADKTVVSDQAAKDFLSKTATIEEKIDGTKLTIVRNDEAWNNDYTKNWIVAYKGNILYPEEYAGVDKELVKQYSIGTSQYSLVHDHLKRIHPNTKSLKRRMEFFVEFVMNKPTLTRDYDNKHALILIASSPTEYEIINGKLKTNSLSFSTDDRNKYATILGMDTPAVLFDGKISDMPDGIVSDKLRKAFKPLANHWKSTEGLAKYDTLKSILTTYESVYGGKPEGVVLKFSDGRISKILQSDQHDKAVRLAKANRYRMDKEDETKYYEAINELAKTIVSDLRAKTFEMALLELSNRVYKNAVPIAHEKKHIINKQDDLFLTAKTLLFKQVKGNNWALFQGRMQPPTKAHISIIETALSKYDGVVVLLIKGNKESSQSPFPLSIQEKILRSVFGDRIVIKQSSSGNLSRILSDMDQNINVIIAGSDRAESYRQQLTSTSNITIEEVERSDEDVSATKLRQALIDNDINIFKQNSDKRTWQFYNELRGLVKGK